MRFSDRVDAGQRLAALLRGYEDSQPLVLGLPRGGVPVAYEVAKALGAPLDVWVVRKVGAPNYPELGVGAVAEGGIVYLNHEAIEQVGASEEEIQDIVQQRSAEVAERIAQFRRGAPPLQLEGRTLILVDDGIATGGTVRAAIQALRMKNPERIVLAVPVAATQSLEALAPLADDIVCVEATPALYAIGAWYDDFRQTSNHEVVRLLELARESREGPRPSAPEQPASYDPQEVTIPLEGIELQGTLSGPSAPVGLVLFAHGSGSSRFSPRNRHVAAMLHRYGLATLLFDLLTAEEGALDELTTELRFDIGLLARRLVEVTDWTRTYPGTQGLPLGYFGSSTGAAAALIAAAQRPHAISAVVSRGGRPDLAESHLERVRAPTLLIVGGDDTLVIDLNRQAASRLSALRRMAIIPGATHLFEEPGALDAVARLAGEWFRQHLTSAQPIAEPSAPV